MIDAGIVARPDKIVIPDSFLVAADRSTLASFEGQPAPVNARMEVVRLVAEGVTVLAVDYGVPCITSVA